MNNKRLLIAGLAGLFLFTISTAFCAEYGGKEHGGKEHGGTDKKGVEAATNEPSKAQIQKTMKEYINEQSEKKDGAFEVNDPETGKIRRLKLTRIHDRVGKTGDLYYSCADFNDLDSKETLDLDLDVESRDGKLSVKDVRIHKVAGKERYTYDEKDNRIPVKK